MGKSKERKLKREEDRASGAPAPTSEDLGAIRRLLLAAYDVGRRDLPWRGESDPYRVWVSEVMLQQTRVETVIPYYRKWVERFPRLDALARAEEDEVLGVWQGLGYYSRARRLLGAARLVRERYGGDLPESAAALRRLPGVGEYTAGAVASIAFGEVVPAVDGNVRRVLARLFDLPDPGPSRLRELAAALVDPARPGDFNQALMELGATVCLPRAPGCASCPLEVLCAARARGTVEERPARRRRAPVPEVDVAVVVGAWLGGEDGLHLLMRRRPQDGLLAGMWEFPGVEIDGGSCPREAAVGLLSRLGLRGAGEPLELERIFHAFSHLKVRYHPSLFRVRGPLAVEGCRWVSRADRERLPIPTAQRRILEATLGVLH